MFRVYHSNQLDLLKDLVFNLMSLEPLVNPLAPEYMLVQSTGMAQWLQMEMAKKFHIAANINFLLPASFIWKMFVKVIPDLPEENLFTKTNMSWKLMHRLPMLLEKKTLTSLRKYLHNDYDKRKLYQLSIRIADLFDQYLVYRSDWLIAWENGCLINGLSECQEWQAILWRDLVSFTESQGHQIWHRANLYQRFVQVLDQVHSPELLDLPQRVFIYGISALPPIYLQVLEKLGHHIDIHLLFTNPCCHYWGDIQDYAFLAKLKRRQRRCIRSNKIRPLFRNPDIDPMLFNEFGEQQLTNPLLASWGKLGRDNLFLLSQINCIDDIDAFVDIPLDNLLHSIQADILYSDDNTVIGFNPNVLNNRTKKRPLDPNDRSITIHICHSAQREVEVLHDYILTIMEENHEIKFRDIIVMIADIDNYAPFIQSTFSSVPNDRYLPFAISDRCAIEENPIILAVLNLLKLPKSRFTSEEVLALLEVPDIAKRFSIDEVGLRLLRRWVMESGIRWGFDDANVESFALPVTGRHTWRFGLQRMLLGYALESRNGDWQGIIPYDESSGLIAELAGNLAEFLSCLDDLRVHLSYEQSLNDWQPLCHELINTFFIRDTENEAVLLLVETQWQQIIEQGVLIYKKPIFVDLLCDSLRTNLEQKSISQLFLTGPINFCTLMPMRSIPFKIVCLLGMNDGMYPRTVAPLNFDLMQQQVRRGDRNRREDDRYLFLEAFLSAQCQLYISYIGRDIQDNTKRYPSIMVKELIDYISQSFCLPDDEKYEIDISEQRIRDHIQIQHSRMPFSAENFQIGKYPQSFATEWLSAITSKRVTQTNFVQLLKKQSIETLSLVELLQFWRHPVRAWFQQRLGVVFWMKESALPDSEPFALSSLDSYQINTQLLNALIEGKNINQIYAQHNAAGNLPHGVFGELFWQAQIEAMNEVAVQVRNKYKKGETWEINLQLNKVQLTGWLTQVQLDGLLRWRPGVLNINDGLLLWLEHLIYCSLGGKGASRMYGSQQSSWYFKALPLKEALFLLETYIDAYETGLTQPLMLFKRSGGAWLDVSFNAKSRQLVEDEITKKKALSKLRHTWYGCSQFEGECSDPYIQRLSCTLNDNIIESIIVATRQWYLPILQLNQS